MDLMRFLALVLAAVPCLPAQTSQINGPVSGYVFDAAVHALRPILGLPGSSLLGRPLSLGFDVASAFVAPRQDFAFVVAADGSLHAIQLNAGTPSERPVDSLPASP